MGVKRKRTSKERNGPSKVDWKPRPFPVHEPREIGSVYHWRDAVRSLYYPYYTGPRAHLRDLCDFTPKSPLYSCRCETTTDERGQYVRKWVHGMLSGQGDRTAHDAKDIEKAPLGRCGEAVDEKAVEWLEQADELVRFIIEHDGLRKYSHVPSKYDELPLSLAPLEDPEIWISNELHRSMMRDALFQGIAEHGNIPGGISDPVTLAGINLFVPVQDVEEARAEIESKLYKPRKGGWNEVVLEALGKVCRSPDDVTKETIVPLLERAGIVMETTGEAPREKVRLRYADGGDIADDIAPKTLKNLIGKIRSGAVPLR